MDHKDSGWSAWCHRCSEPGFVPHPQPSLGERLARLRAVRAVEDEAIADPRPPQPANFDPSTWPHPARVWLYRAGLGNDTLVRLGFYWCERLERVVMPVFASGRLVYWQARSLDRKPKYINPPIDKPVFKQGQGDVLVLCEDTHGALKSSMAIDFFVAIGKRVAAAWEWLLRNGRWRIALLGLGALLSVLAVRGCLGERDARIVAEAGQQAAQAEVQVIADERVAADRAVTGAMAGKAAISKRHEAGSARLENTLDANAEWAAQPVPADVLDSLRD